MTDRELLELAAKAAGMVHMKYAGGSGLSRMLDPSRPETTGSIGPCWNPLADDADALRLVVKLRLVVHVWDEGDTASAAKTEPNGDDPELSGDAWFAEDAHACNGIESATRRAIVRAAAAIQQAKEAQ